MTIQTVFKRYEIKYLLTVKQKEEVLLSMKPYMMLDQYGRTTIKNIYYDTDNYLLARKSLEKPIFKEKLRIRCYNDIRENDQVFVEIKRKYDSIVYKRRMLANVDDAMDWLSNKTTIKDDSQIAQEIDYFLDYYQTIGPKVFLSYQREAYYCPSDPNLRLTFDDSIMFRQNNLSLKSDAYGKSILDDDMVLLEIKCLGAIPLWLSKALNDLHVYKTSFSKYTLAYQTILAESISGGNNVRNFI